MKDISVAFLALIVFEGSIGLLAVFFVIVFIQEKDMGKEILHAMPCFGIEKVKGVMGGREMTVHTVGHKSLGVIGVCGGFPRVIGELDFVAHGAELRGRGANHCVVGDTEDGEGYNDADGHVNGGPNGLLPGGRGAPRNTLRFCHIPSASF
jgi:hypothetical protein